MGCNPRYHFVRACLKLHFAVANMHISVVADGMYVPQRRDCTAFLEPKLDRKPVWALKATKAPLIDLGM